MNMFSQGRRKPLYGQGGLVKMLAIMVGRRGKIKKKTLVKTP